jgi:hypothetical protein
LWNRRRAGVAVLCFDLMGSCRSKFHAFSPSSDSLESGNGRPTYGSPSSAPTSAQNNYQLTLSSRSNPSPPPFIPSPFRPSSYRSSNNSSITNLFSNEAYSPVYHELHFSSHEIQLLHDIFLHLLNTQPSSSPSPSPSSTSFNPQSNLPFEDRRIPFDHFFQSFNLQHTPLNDQLFSLWFPSSPTSLNFLYFICMIWYALTMDENDVITYIFSLYSNHATHLLSLSSIKSAIDHIHPFAASNKPLQKILKLLGEPPQGQNLGQDPSSSSTSSSLSYREWSEWCERYPLLLEPIYLQQTNLRQQICNEQIWLTILEKKEQTPSQHSPNYLHTLHNFYDEAMLKHTLTSRLNDLSRQYSSKSSSGNVMTLPLSLSSNAPPSLATDSDEDYPDLSLRRKPSSRSSSTTSLQSMVVVSDCSTPFSVAGIVLQNKMYDTDGDTISVASGCSGKCSDFNSYRPSLHGDGDDEDGALPGGQWAGGDDGDGGLLTPRSVLSNALDHSDDEDR